MTRKLIAILAIVVILGQMFGFNSSYALTSQQAYAGNQLRTLGILKGYSDGGLKLENNIIRSEVATMTVRILGYENTVIVGNEADFSDVNKEYWGYNYIQNAYKLNVIKGYPNKTFRPVNNITYAEVVAIMVNALSEGENLEGEWPMNYINKAKELGVIPKDSHENPNKIVTRGEMAVIVWDTLLVKQ